MASWKPDELAAIAAASELEITSRRSDGTLRKPVTIWVIRRNYLRRLAGGVCQVSPAAGSQGWPCASALSTPRVSWPCLRAVEM